ncbi:hypothetical protein GCM10020367_09820 [Streptomyces sannanensis]|uniref:Uncharacterized protein n=1 Tax=Streptomyces sannanensis TaxID=285536 RepID=A0ABP6S631_9ACTN
MGHTKHRRSMRHTLRREITGTLGLLTDAQDFAAMRKYRSFAFEDHETYLRQAEGLLRTLSAQGAHTSVALFDPEEFAEYCTAAGLDPDTADSRMRFTAEVASGGARVPYTGQPIDQLVPQLIDTAVRKATWDYATVLLARLGDCAECGRDIGHAAFDRASRMLMALLDAAGPGTHHLVCSVPVEDELLLAVLLAECPEGEPARLDQSEAAEFVTVLAVGIAVNSTGGVVLRTTAPDTPDRLHGWRLQQGRLDPLTAAEVFSAYCTDADTGEPVSPEPGVEYRAGFPVTPAEDPGSHH